MDIFRNPTKSVPKKDEQIIRVDFEQSEIAGRKDNMPKATPTQMQVKHVPNEG